MSSQIEAAVHNFPTAFLRMFIIFTPHLDQISEQEFCATNERVLTNRWQDLQGQPEQQLALLQDTIFDL